MYSFLYEYMKPKYGQSVQVAYTDTDSFVLEIKTPDVYADIRNDPGLFDTWDYPEDNIYGIERRNNKVVGKFKDELNGEILVEFVALRPKCYALRTLGQLKEIKKAKGVKKNVISNHNLYTISMEKIALNPFDDKRYMIKPDCIDTLAWGHHQIDSEKMNAEYQYVLDIAQCMKDMKRTRKK